MLSTSRLIDSIEASCRRSIIIQYAECFKFDVRISEILAYAMEQDVWRGSAPWWIEALSKPLNNIDDTRNAIAHLRSLEQMVIERFPSIHEKMAEMSKMLCEASSPEAL